MREVGERLGYRLGHATRRLASRDVSWSMGVLPPFAMCWCGLYRWHSLRRSHADALVGADSCSGDRPHGSWKMPISERIPVMLALRLPMYLVQPAILGRRYLEVGVRRHLA